MHTALLPELLPQTDEAVHQDKHLSPICRNCILQHTRVKKLKFDIRCRFIDQRTIDVEEILESLRTSGLSDDEQLEIICRVSPSFFAHHVINLKRLRPGQLELLHCTSLRQVLRWPRRVGKSAAVAIKFLHVGCTQPNMGMMYICKHESQVYEFFGKVEKLAQRSDWVMDRIIQPPRCKNTYVSSPTYRMTFTNGSFITGHVLGKTAADGKGSATIRGLGISGFDELEQAGLMFADEYDYLTEAQIKAFRPILTEGGGNTIAFMAASTPTGMRQDFYEICRGSRASQYREDHKTIFDIYSREKAEDLIADAPNEDFVIHELLAQFGQEMVGVFKEGDIQAAEWEPTWKKYPQIDCSKPDAVSLVRPKRKGVHRAMGVDWNSPKVGARLIVVENDPLIKDKPLRVIHVERISTKRFSQTAAVKAVIAVNRAYDCDAIYVDYGAGSTQVEMIHIHGETAAGRVLDDGFKSTIATPRPVDQSLADLVAIDMNARTEIYDPQDAESKNKKNKPFMISLVARVLEDGLLGIPAQEYKKGLSSLPESMRMFRKLRISQSGDPVYSQDNDHDVIALALAVMAFYVECTNMPFGPRRIVRPTAANAQKAESVHVTSSGRVKAVVSPQSITRSVIDPAMMTAPIEPEMASNIISTRTVPIPNIPTRSQRRETRLGSFATGAQRGETSEGRYRPKSGRKIGGGF